MATEDPFDAYVYLAKDLFEGGLLESELPAASTKLPLLNPDLLSRIAQFADRLNTTQPRYGWAITQVAHSAAISQTCDVLIQSLAAWYLARACNHWTQPKRVNEAVAAARSGFKELNESGWLAACEWQLNALPWTRSNFTRAAEALKEALRGMEQAGLTKFVPECRLSLAYTQILIGEHAAAMENIQRSEESFLASGDLLNQARCWQMRAGSLRLQDRFPEAHQKLEQALAVYEQRNAITDQARAHYHMALGYLLQVDNLTEAVAEFSKAADLFDSIDLDLWRGMCINNLGSVYLFTGELALADKYYREARAIFILHEIRGLLADNLHDHGEVNILRGKPQISAEQFKQSIEIYEELGAQLSAAIGMTNLGKAYGQNGRYQDALFYLEQAIDRLESLNSPLRLGTCEKYAALIWSQLNQPEMTHKHLDRAAVHYQQAGQTAMLTEAHNIRATAFCQQGKNAEAIVCLRESLSAALAYGVRPQAALARRLLGEALAQNGQNEEALEYLKQSQIEFSDMDMSMDLAACLVAAGTCHSLMFENGMAHAAFDQAIRLSEGILPEIEWRAHIGLGDLAASRSDTDSALYAYRRAMDSFVRIRQNFWQPSLAGSYLQKPSHIFERIVAFASTADTPEDALLFIEQSKASTLPEQLLTSRLSTDDSNSQELKDIEAEILFLQDQLQTSLDMPLPLRASSDYRQIRTRLGEKTRQYETLKARQERKVSSGEIPMTSAYDRFDLSFFRKLAKRALQKKWIALDYYLLDDHLITVLLTPERCEVLDTLIPYRFRVALEVCRRAGQNPELPTQADLQVLGQVLIPPSAAAYITPDTFLLLSPHKGLHTIPWPALQPESASQSLAQLCIPTVVPSLQSLGAIWQRNSLAGSSRQASGLVIGLSAFGGRHRELPHVKSEISFLSSRFGPGGVFLTEEAATWENMLKLNERTMDGENKGLSRIAWMHIASHFFSDALTGRLSGLALWDGDVWLDKLRDLSPLPALVTLSACNSISSFVYQGDEHVDVPTTFLTAGADRVVGSLWPILDDAAAIFTSSFYAYYLAGMSPAQAVAQVQRDLIDQGKPVDQWASFISIGAP